MHDCLCLLRALQVSQHPRCRIRVTIMQPGGKVQLSALIVAHFPVNIDQRIAGEAGSMLAENG